MFAPELRLLAGQVLRAEVVDPLDRPVGDAHPHRGEAGGEPVLGAAPPANPSPRPGGQHRLGRDQYLVWDVALARSTTTRDGEDNADIDRIHFLLSKDPDRPGEPALAQPWRNGALRP